MELAVLATPNGEALDSMQGAPAHDCLAAKDWVQALELRPHTSFTFFHLQMSRLAHPLSVDVPMLLPPVQGLSGRFASPAMTAPWSVRLVRRERRSENALPSLLPGKKK